MKIEEIINFKRPTCVIESRHFLGMFGFYRKFIENCCHEIVPLCSLLRKNAAFIWLSECEAVFQYLKEQLMNPDMLHYPNFSKAFVLQ